MLIMNLIAFALTLAITIYFYKKGIQNDDVVLMLFGSISCTMWFACLISVYFLMLEALKNSC